MRSGKMACGSRAAPSQRGEEMITKSISDGLVSDNAWISVSSTDSNPRRVSVIRGIDPLIITIFPL